MVEGTEAVIKFGIGPFKVDKVTGPYVAEQVVFRHFKAGELLIAREFIRRAYIEGTYYFDVYLMTAEAEKFIEKHGEEFWRLAIPFMHRIDAVCFTPDVIYLIEFKLRVKYSGIGQLLGYRDWFVRQYKPDRPVKMVLVAVYEIEELEETLRKHDIMKIKIQLRPPYIE